MLSWLGACALGMWMMTAHATQPGAAAHIAKRLPQAVAARIAAACGSELATEQIDAPLLAADTEILLVAAHPQCPCLATTLDELERVLARARADARRPTPLICLLAYLPTLRPKAWRHRGETEHVRFDEISPTLWLEDRDGELSAMLGMRTSGHVALYGTAETAASDSRPLRFEGGVTASRGHAGDSPGADRLLAVLTAADESPSQGKSSPPGQALDVQYPVFGCALQSTHANCADCLPRRPLEGGLR
ncbi:MAG: hypothetical protein AB8H80_21500 [Planctomycetota bacterium]